MTLHPTALVRALLARGFGPDYVVYAHGARVHVAVGARGRVVVRHGTFFVEQEAHGVVHSEAVTDPFAQLPALFARLPGGTAYGFAAFDLCRYYADYPRSIDEPFHFILPRHRLVFDDGQLCEAESSAPPGGARDWLRDLAREEIADRGRRPDALPDAQAGMDDYEARARAAIESVRAGRAEKVIVSRRVAWQGKLDPLGSFEESLPRAASRRFAFHLGGHAGAGIPPGTVFVADAAGRFTTNPLAGTKPRGRTEQEDGKLRRELFTDAKEVREHALSVLLAQEEVLSVVEPESFRIRDFMQVKPFPFTQHLSSLVEGRLRAGLTLWDGVRAVFPPVTVSGVDKASAIRILGELEPWPRGVYGGAVGFVGSEGADLAIPIRSAFESGGTITLNAGAGFVAESRIEDELDESRNKLRTLLECVRVKG